MNRPVFRYLLSISFAVVLIATTAFGWYSYNIASERIGQRSVWLGVMAMLQHDVARTAINGQSASYAECTGTAREIVEGGAGAEAVAEAARLFEICTDLQREEPITSEQLSQLNEVVTRLTWALRAETQRYSAQAQNAFLAVTVLIVVFIFVTQVMALAFFRATQLKKVESESNAKLLGEVEERLKVSEALKQSEERLAATLYSIRDAVIATDELGMVDRMNPVAERLTGWTLEEAKGKKLDEVLKMVQEGNNRPTGDPFEHISRGGGTEPRRQVRVVAKSGETIPVERTVAAMMGPRSFLGIVVGLRDISDERRAATDLEQVQRDFRQVIERSPDGVAIQRDGLLVYVNPALASLLGYRSRESLLHYSLSNLVHPAQRAEARSHFSDPEIQTLPGTTKEVSFLKTNGDTAILELAPGVVVSFEGERSVLIAARDVTERQRMVQRLVQLDRLTSVGSLTGGIVNQINNPLSVCIAGVGEAIEQLGAASDQPVEPQRILTDVRENLEQVVRIVKDLNSFSVAEGTEPRAVDLRRVIEACLRLTSSELRVRGAIRERYAEVRPVLASEPHLRHLLVNILLHAAKQLDETSKARNELSVTVEPDGDRVKVIVGDNGPGIHPDELARIFDPMRNPQRLGLALCQGLASELNAGIRVDSALGRGTRIIVDLPTANYLPSRRISPRSIFPEDGMVAPDTSDSGLTPPRTTHEVRTTSGTPTSPTPTSEPSSLETPTSEAPTTSLRVLLIDDNEQVAQALRRTLRGHEVTISTSGREAVALCDRQIFDVVICDLMMDDFSGMDVYDHLSQRHPELVTRMVFMSGGAYTARSRLFLDTVQNPRISKPFNTTVVRQILSSYLRRTQ